MHFMFWQGKMKTWRACLAVAGRTCRGGGWGPRSCWKRAGVQEETDKWGSPLVQRRGLESEELAPAGTTGLGGEVLRQRLWLGHEGMSPCEPTLSQTQSRLGQVYVHCSPSAPRSGWHCVQSVPGTPPPGLRSPLCFVCPVRAVAVLLLCCP